MIWLCDDVLDFIDWSAPVNKASRLNDNLLAWWLCVPGCYGFGSATWRPIFGAVNGTLTSMDASSDWIGASHHGGFGALDHDGSNDRVEFGASIINGLDDFTVQFKVRFRGFGSPETARVLCHNGTYSTNPAPGDLFTVNMNSTYIGVEFSPGGTYTAFGGSYTELLNNWTDIALTRTGAVATLYLNGLQFAQKTDCSTSSLRATKNWRTCADETNSSPLQGEIDSIRILDRCLQAAEVREYYEDSTRGYQQTLNRLPIQWRGALSAFVPAWATRSTTIAGVPAGA